MASSIHATFDVFRAIVNEHTDRVLAVQRLNALHQEAVFAGEAWTGPSPAEVRQQLVEAQGELREYLRRRPPQLLAQAYKRTKLVNFQEHPHLSPFAYSSKGPVAAQQEVKSQLRRFLDARCREGVQFTVVETTANPLVVRMTDTTGQRLMDFLFAVVAVGGVRHLLFFAEWSLDAVIGEVRLRHPVEARRFVLPLALYPFEVRTVAQLCKWLVDDLGRAYFKTRLAGNQEVTGRVIERLNRVRGTVDIVAAYPELASVVSAAVEKMEGNPT